MTPDQLNNLGAELFGWGWQTRLAEYLNVTSRTVRRWSAGDCCIPHATTIAIALLVKQRQPVGGSF